MGPVGHGSISVVVGAGVWAGTGSPLAGVTALGVGVLTDIDHLYDYYQWYVRGRLNKVHLWFHAWEYSLAGLAVLGLVFYHPLLLGVVLGHLAHVATDHFSNDLSPWGYSITYRALKRFEATPIAPHHDARITWWHLVKRLPFKRRLATWFVRRVNLITASPAGAAKSNED